MRKLTLNGRTVLVTGAARGLGRQLALGLGVGEGSNLILVDRNERGLDFHLVVELSLLFLSRFKEKGEGFICNITSLGSFVPIPYQAFYAAAKAAAQSFSESLLLENRKGPVMISTVAPSGILTDMIVESGLTNHMRTHRYSYLSAADAAGQVIRGMKRGKENALTCRDPC